MNKRKGTIDGSLIRVEFIAKRRSKTGFISKIIALNDCSLNDLAICYNTLRNDHSGRINSAVLRE